MKMTSAVSGILRRQRVYKLIIFLGLAGFIFLCFQVFTIQVLNQNSGDGESSHRSKIYSSEGHLKLKERLKELKKQQQIKAGLIDKSDCVSDECKFKYKNDPNKDTDVDPDQLKKDANENMLNINNAKHKSIGGNKEHIVQQKDIVKDDNLYNVDEKLVKNAINFMDLDLTMLPRGASIYDAQYYILPQGSTTFTCIHSKENISISAINDDYCDCKDSSDEPGTNACPNSKFYCKFQLSSISKLKWLPSSRVNDGLCDCCDGSDEWQHRKLPDRLLLNDGKVHYGVYQAPCQDRCQGLKEQNQENLRIRKEGAKLKQQYVQAALGQVNPDVDLYGADGAFLMLSNECFSRSANKYEYDICPFKEVKQKDGHDTKMIGRVPRWLSKGGRNGYKLEMVNGESVQCPGLRSRMATLIFECGVQNQVDSIQETQVCEYTIHFTTPAVC